MSHTRLVFDIGPIPAAINIIKVIKKLGYGYFLCAASYCGYKEFDLVLLFSSLIMYAAAAQLVAYDMISHGAEGVLIFIAGSVLNLQFLLYSAGIALHLRSVGLLQRLFGAYALTGQAFGITIVQYHKESEKSCTPFYLGAAATMWIMYQLAAAVGI